MDSSKRPASAHEGRPATNFVRVDRFTDEERAQMLAEAEAERRERAEAQPDAWEGLAQGGEEAQPEGSGTRSKALVVLVVLGLAGIGVLALLGLASLGAWIALNL